MAHVTLTSEVADILGRSVITTNTLALPPQQLERKTYEAVAKALKAAGGRWKTNLKAFLFDGDPRAKLGMALESGVVIDEKKVRQAYYTPPDVAEEVALLAAVAGCRVLEPSAGAGALAQACFRWGAERVDCVEMEETCLEPLMAVGCRVVIGDFLALDPRPQFERVVMNPPFTKGQDVKHVTRALEWLAPGGSLFSIVPASDNPKLTALGAQVVKRFPAGAFKESGTSIATMLIAIDRLL